MTKPNVLPVAYVLPKASTVLDWHWGHLDGLFLVKIWFYVVIRRRLTEQIIEESRSDMRTDDDATCCMLCEASERTSRVMRMYVMVPDILPHHRQPTVIPQMSAHS